MPQSAEILQSIIESAESGIITFDSRGVMQTFNPAAERLFGYQSGEMIDRNVSLLMPEPDHGAHDGYLNNYLTSGVARIIGMGREVTGLRKDGTRFPLHLSVGKFAIDGQPMFTGVVHDLTAEVEQRNSLRASEDRFQQLVANIDEMFMFRTVAPVKYIYVSPAVERIYGITVDQALADPEIFFTVIHPDDAALVRKTMIEADTKGRVEMESRIVRPDGELRWVWIRYRPVKTAPGEPRLVAITVSDITARKAAQRGEEAARAEAVRANDAKSEFLSRMSHELRTPLNAILGFSQLLGMDELNTDQQESVRQINRGGRHLLELINEVLDISRIESGHMALSSEAVFVSDVIDEVLDLMGPLAKVRKLLVTSPPVGTFTEHVLADRQRLKQVLLNLVSNAIKYNRDDGQISLTCAVQPDGMFAITVSDTGIGVPPGEIDRLFAPFDRMGAENTDVEGTGVGLALSLALVQTMGGRLEVESTLGVGSSFTVLLPLIEAAEPQTAEQSPVTNDFGPATADVAQGLRGPLTVVYIEDNLASLRLVQQVAARRPGVHLVHAMHGQVGLDLVSSMRPDLILLDLHLPDMSGEEVLRRLRAESANENTPIVVLSADATPGRVRRLRDTGASGYLTKPVDVKELLAWFDEPLRSEGETP